MTSLNLLVGDMARLSVTIKNIAGAVADPSALTLEVKDPGGVITPYSGSVVKDSVGKYHYDLPLSDSGYYKFRWGATGENQGVVEGGFSVSPQSF